MVMIDGKMKGRTLVIASHPKAGIMYIYHGMFLCDNPNAIVRTSASTNQTLKFNSIVVDNNYST